MYSSSDENLSDDMADPIERVCGEAVHRFGDCRGDLLAQLRVCAEYFEHGKLEGLSHGEPIDFLGISTPSVLSRAGYSDDEALRLMKGLPLLTEDTNGVLQPPTVLPQIAPLPSTVQSTLNL